MSHDVFFVHRINNNNNAKDPAQDTRLQTPFLSGSFLLIYIRLFSYAWFLHKLQPTPTTHFSRIRPQCAFYLTGKVQICRLNLLRNIYVLIHKFFSPLAICIIRISIFIHQIRHLSNAFITDFC